MIAFLNRWLWRRTEPAPVIQGINTWNDVNNANLDMVWFHGWMKTAFYKLLSKLPKCPEHWIKNLKGNYKLIWEIYQDYLEREGQQRRRNVLSRFIPWALCVLNYDDNYDEVADYFLYRILERKDKFSFNHANLRPEYWYNDITGRKLTVMRPAWTHHYKINYVNDYVITLDRPTVYNILGIWADSEEFVLVDKEHSIQRPGGHVTYPILARSKRIEDLNRRLQK